MQAMDEAGVASLNDAYTQQRRETPFADPEHHLLRVARENGLLIWRAYPGGWLFVNPDTQMYVFGVQSGGFVIPSDV